MKKVGLILIITFLSINAQEFTIEKILGNAKFLRGISENWERLEIGQKLSNDDLILTESNSLVQLVKVDERFLLKEDAAIGLNYIKKISINDLILALTLDEIRNIPKIKKNSLAQNTAVYGSDVKEKTKLQITENILGEKKINGAKQLNENGYVESSIILAKEVFRNYPNTAENFEDRMYFADLLNDLELYQEALSEYQRIEKLSLITEQKNRLTKKYEEISLKLMDN